MSETRALLARVHAESVAFLDAALAEPFAGPTVVLTHHAPSAQSIAPEYARSALNPAYASDLTGLINRHQPLTWIHGHTHASADYRIGRTRVLNNPHGYGRENPGFDPALILDTEATS